MCLLCSHIFCYDDLTMIMSMRIVRSSRSKDHNDLEFPGMILRAGKRGGTSWSAASVVVNETGNVCPTLTKQVFFPNPQGLLLGEEGNEFTLNGLKPKPLYANEL